MKLYFFRHAIAEERNPDGSGDFGRALTKKGIANTEVAAKALIKLGLKPARLYSSPLTRARQTAEILADALDTAVQVRAEVEPGFDVARLEPLLRELGADDEVIVVGHEPDFSRTISALTGGGVVTMKKGGLARVDITGYQPLNGALIWMIAPKIFNSLGK